MPISTFPIPPDWPKILEAILERAQVLGPGGVLAFDLDSTVFDNRPRQARIVREYGEARGIAALTRCQPRHFTDGWDMRAAFRNCGLAHDEAERLHADAREFWQARFFTSAYCTEDEMIPGASEFLRRALATRAKIAYLTGRPEQMREGTLEAMSRHRLPLPDGEKVFLLMKPASGIHDDDFKREAQARIGELGEVIAAFDNEPMHVNDYRRRFPEATIVHLATDHSGRPVELLDGIVSVPHFRCS
jgi:hypothetical protein